MLTDFLANIIHMSSVSMMMTSWKSKKKITVEKRQIIEREIEFVFDFFFFFLFQGKEKFLGRTVMWRRSDRALTSGWRATNSCHGNYDTEDSALSWEATDIKAFFCKDFFFLQFFYLISLLRLFHKIRGRMQIKYYPLWSFIS